MFDHVKFGVSDYPATRAFFLRALEPLGVTVVSEWPPSGVELSQAQGKVSLCLYEFTWRFQPGIAIRSMLSIARLWRQVARTMVRRVCA